MSYFEKARVSYDDTFNIDAFGRLRVSQLTTQFDGKQLHDALPLYYDVEEIGTGSASHSTTDAESTFTTSANSDAVVMQTKQRFNYMTGKSALGMQTFRNFNHETNVTKRVGYFNSNTSTPFDSSKDGFWIETDGTNIQFVISKGGTANTITQSNWNIDKVDGTGVSGVDLDLGTETGNLLLWWQFEWLGVGAVTFGFVSNNIFIPCHREDHILLDGIYMESPNHSLRAEIRQTGAGSGTFRYICSTFNTEGSIDVIGKDGGITDDSTHLNANNVNSWYVAIAIRLSSSKFDTLVDVLSSSLKSNTNDDFEYRVCFNPTYSGTLTYNSITNYAVEYALGATANTVSAFGSILNGGYGIQATAKDFNLKTALRLGAKIDGTQDEIIVCVKPHTSNLDIHRAINWRELS